MHQIIKRSYFTAARGIELRLVKRFAQYLYTNYGFSILNDRHIFQIRKIFFFIKRCSANAYKGQRQSPSTEKENVG